MGGKVGSCFHNRTLITFLIKVLFDAKFIVVSFPVTVNLNVFVKFLGLMPCLRAVNVVPAVLLTLLGTCGANRGF